MLTLKHAGGLGSVGSLLSLWLSEQADGTHLWLLGRSGRGSWDPLSIGNGLVTLARCDVSVLEETDFVARGAGKEKALQVCFISDRMEELKMVIC